MIKAYYLRVLGSGGEDPYIINRGLWLNRQWVLAMEISWVHPHCLDCLLAVGHAIEPRSCLDFCHRIIMWVFMFSCFSTSSKERLRKRWPWHSCGQDCGCGGLQAMWSHPWPQMPLQNLTSPCTISPSVPRSSWLLCNCHWACYIAKISCWRTFLRFLTVMPQVKV